MVRAGNLPWCRTHRGRDHLGVRQLTHNHLASPRTKSQYRRGRRSWFKDPNRFKSTGPQLDRQPKSFKSFLRGPSKYGAYSANYNGRTFDSRKEALYAAQLDVLRKAQSPAERVVDVQYQVRVPLDVNGKHVADYYCDFLVRYADGREQYEEVKGFETDVWRLKEKLFRAIHPDRILKVIR